MGGSEDAGVLRRRWGPFARGPLRRWEVAILTGSAGVLVGLIVAPTEMPPIAWDKVRLGTVSEWLTFTATGLAGDFAFRAAGVAYSAYDAQVKADAKRDEVERRRVDTEVRAQASVISIVRAGELPLDDEHCTIELEVANASLAPVTEVTVIRSDAGEQSVVTRWPVLRGTVRHPAEENVDNQQLVDLAFAVAFRDGAGRRWVKWEGGALEEVL